MLFCFVRVMLMHYAEGVAFGQRPIVRRIKLALSRCIVCIGSPVHVLVYLLCDDISHLQMRHAGAVY